MKVLYALSLLLICGCVGWQTADKIETKEVVFNVQTLGYPVRIQTIERSGMIYMIASATYGEAGVDIINVTLDSLMAEYYRREINE